MAHRGASSGIRAWVEVALWVFEANARARRSYERAGFRPDGRCTVDPRSTAWWPRRWSGRRARSAAAELAAERVAAAAEEGLGLLLGCMLEPEEGVAAATVLAAVASVGPLAHDLDAPWWVGAPDGPSR